MCLGSSPPSLHCPGAPVPAPTHCEGDAGSSALYSAGSPPMGGLLHPHCGCHGNTVCVQQCESTPHDGGIHTQRKHKNIVDLLRYTDMRTCGPWPFELSHCKQTVLAGSNCTCCGGSQYHTVTGTEEVDLFSIPFKLLSASGKWHPLISHSSTHPPNLYHFKL